MVDTRFEDLLDPFRDHLSDRGLGAQTIRAYVGIVRAYLTAHSSRPHHGPTIVAWTTARLAGAKVGSAVIWYSGIRAWMDLHGLDSSALKRPPRPSVSTVATPLGADELAAYHLAAETCNVPAVRCLLHLLPTEGLAVGDLCRLRMGAAVKGAKLARLTEYLVFRGLDANDSPWMFPAPLDPASPISTDAVRKELRKIRGDRDWTTRRLTLCGVPGGARPAAEYGA